MTEVQVSPWYPGIITLTSQVGVSRFFSYSYILDPVYVHNTCELNM